MLVMMDDGRGGDGVGGGGDAGGGGDGSGVVVIARCSLT